MRSLHPRVPWLAVALALVLGDATHAQESGRVDVAVGVVEVGTGDPPVWSKARVGDPVRPGDRIRTGPDGRAELRLGRGTVRLYENSLLHVPAAAPANGQRVDLDHGASLFDVQKGSGRTFEVHTPEAVAMVKGTRFAVVADSAGAAVSVYRGLVGVRDLSEPVARELLVRPGSAAVGGPDAPFVLRLLAPGADPWGAWVENGAPPETPAALLGPKRERAPLRMARASARAAAERMAPEALARAQAEPVAAAAPDTADSEALSPDQLELDDVSAFDAGADAAASQLVVTHYAAAGETLTATVPTLLWVNVSSSGGTVNQTLSAMQLLSIEATGNTSAYDPDLVTILQVQGIDPQDYATTLLSLVLP